MSSGDYDGYYVLCPYCSERIDWWPPQLCTCGAHLFRVEKLPPYDKKAASVATFKKRKHSQLRALVMMEEVTP